MTEQSPIIHRLPWDTSEAHQAVEYPLSCAWMPKEITAALHPWTRAFVGQKESSAANSLKSRWHAIEHRGLRRLADHLLTYSPRSILICGGHSWLVIKDPKKTEWSRVGDRWLIAPPPDAAILQQQMQSFGLERITLLREFAFHFIGVREDIPEMAGSFPTPDRWQQFGGPGYEYIKGSCATYRDWQESIVFYEARNGDHLLLRQSGSLGWWDHELNEVRGLVNSFDEFPDYYSHAITRRFPFDSCGMAESM